jgi:hypothetical protein
MEAVGFIGGAFTLAGLAAALTQWRRHRAIIKWAGALAIIGLAMVATAVIVTAGARTVAPAAAPPAAVPTAPASTPAVVVPAWSTYEQFYALTPAQQSVVMQQALDHSNQIVEEALRTLNANLLSQVASGSALDVLTKSVQAGRQAGHPIGSDHQYRITAIYPQVPPTPLVIVHVVGTERSWYLGPTGQPITATSSRDGSESIHFVLGGGGQWKIQEAHSDSEVPVPAAS